MKPTSHAAAWAVTCFLTTAAAAVAQVQGPAPIPSAAGNTVGVIGLDGTVDKFYGVTQEALIRTADGVRHLVHLSGRTVVHGASEAGDAPFNGLEEGSRVVVHCVVEGDRKTAVEIDRVGSRAMRLAEGTVEHIDRAARRLTIRLADGTVMTLKLTDHAARNVARDVDRTDRVVVYYADGSGERVAHFFKKAK